MIECRLFPPCTVKIPAWARGYVLEQDSFGYLLLIW
jgi:hypothetical protein